MRKLGDSSMLMAAGRFEGSTSYSSDFVQKDLSNRKVRLDLRLIKNIKQEN